MSGIETLHKNLMLWQSLMKLRSLNYSIIIISLSIYPRELIPILFKNPNLLFNQPKLYPTLLSNYLPTQPRENNQPNANAPLIYKLLKDKKESLTPLWVLPPKLTLLLKINQILISYLTAIMLDLTLPIKFNPIMRKWQLISSSQFRKRFI